MSIQINQYSHSENDLHYWECICVCGEPTTLNTKELNGEFKGCRHCSEYEGYVPPYKQVYDRYKQSAEKRNIKFDLSIAFFKKFITNPCVYCGINHSLTIENKRFTYHYNGLDRLDNDDTYHYSNVYTCCNFCNRAKNDMTTEEFNSWVKRLSTYGK